MRRGGGGGGGGVVVVVVVVAFSIAIDTKQEFVQGVVDRAVDPRRAAVELGATRFGGAGQNPPANAVSRLKDKNVLLVHTRGDETRGDREP